MTPHIPGYELLQPILMRNGWGSEVYRARHVGSDTVVLVKVYGPHAAEDEQARQRFHSNCTALARLSHPNIVSLHDHGDADERFYVCTEYLEGGNLLDRLRLGGPLAPRTAAHLFALLADALQYLHGEGIVHRNLNLDHVVFSASGMPKLTGFRLIDPIVAPHIPGPVLGTPRYMAPEALRGLEARPGTDVWGLGAVLYEALTGRVPFSGHAMIDLLLQIIEVAPQRPRQVRPEIPTILELICLKCLEKEPERRYRSAKDLADDLRAFLEGRPTEAGRPVAERRRSFWQRLFPWGR
jgi:eukaryotic-like serine/threonine-protein kinase